jgi:hypothetical protein
MADRIVGLSTVFIIALLTQRAFQIGQLSNLPNLELAFSSPNINWYRGIDNDELQAPLAAYAKKRNYNDSILAKREFYAVNTASKHALYRKVPSTLI